MNRHAKRLARGLRSGNLRPWLAAGLGAAGLGLAGVAGADEHAGGAGEEQPGRAARTAAWDQARVTELAGKLAETLDGLRDRARSQPPDSIASGQARARMRLLDQLRLIERESRSLHDELAKGEGRAATRPIFHRIDSTRRSAAEQARRMFLPEQTLDQMEQARSVLEELRPYYGVEPDPRSGPRGPKRDAQR